MQAWLNSAGVYADNLREDTITALLADETVTGAARRVLEIRSVLGSASVKNSRSRRVSRRAVT